MNTLKKIWTFYYDGFRNMSSLGRSLWLLVLVKLFIMFVILRIFFFRPALAEYETDAEKSQAVIEQLTR